MSVSVFQAPSSLSAVSLSPDATLAVVGGRDGMISVQDICWLMRQSVDICGVACWHAVLKVVRIDSGEIIDGFNIRVPSSRSKQNHYAVDVKWHPDPGGKAAAGSKNSCMLGSLIALCLLLSMHCFSGHTLIATASTNGVIVLWDHSKVRAGHNTAATGNTF